VLLLLLLLLLLYVRDYPSHQILILVAAGQIKSAVWVASYGRRRLFSSEWRMCSACDAVSWYE
jgi:hypothetical protein